METNKRYQEIVTRVVSLATGALVLPTLVLREFLGIPKEKALVPFLNRWAYLGWGSLSASIVFGLVYSWLSVKWVKHAWGEPTFFSATTLESSLNSSFVLMMAFFALGIISMCWFFISFNAVT
jgi:hypothetical protein